MLFFCRSRDFNPRSREGSDVGKPASLREHGEFQSTLPRRERRCAQPSGADAPIRFQSTLPRRERPCRISPCTQYANNFNPRSREGSDSWIKANNAIGTISIHAPAKGATTSGSGQRTHTPNFNPRSREGSDPVCVQQIAIRAAISIHAPAKGATRSRKKTKQKISISIHAPAKGATSAAIRLTR